VCFNHTAVRIMAPNVLSGLQFTEASRESESKCALLEDSD
jgi:hypothetical protein